MGFQRAVEELRERAEHWEQHGMTFSKLNPKGSWKDSIKRAKELKAAADALETLETDGYHDLTRNKNDLPAPGERVIICLGYAFTGEGYVKDDGKWYRYCDFGPVDEFMTAKVVGWKKMPRPMTKPGQKAESRAEETPSNNKSP